MDNNEKPIVRYTRTANDPGYKIIQYMGISGSEFTCASIKEALDHPRLGREHVRTSTIVSVGQDGVIETRNTIYVPEMRENFGMM